MFGVGRNGMINPPDDSRQFHLDMAEIAVFDQDVYDLVMDLTLIIDMAKVCIHESSEKKINKIFFSKTEIKAFYAFH